MNQKDLRKGDWLFESVRQLTCLVSSVVELVGISIHGVAEESTEKKKTKK